MNRLPDDDGPGWLTRASAIGFREEVRALQGAVWRFAIGDEIYTISDLEQVRILADPFRLKLLGAFGRRPRTTKQVAQQLGEKPTKLYHHVEALKRLGLLTLKATRANRGTLEKYYQAVATRFRIGAALFSPGETSDPMADETAAMLMSILDTTRAELAEVLNRSADGSENCSASSAMVARMLLRGKPERIEQFRARLLALLDQFKAETAGVESGQTDAYGLTLAFYPMPRTTERGEPVPPGEPAGALTGEGHRDPRKRRVPSHVSGSAGVKRGKTPPGPKSPKAGSPGQTADSTKRRRRQYASRRPGIRRRSERAASRRIARTISRMNQGL